MAYKSSFSTLAWVFFERLVRSTKELLRKELKAYKLTYEKLQTILFEIETVTTTVTTTTVTTTVKTVTTVTTTVTTTTVTTTVQLLIFTMMKVKVV